MMKQILILLLLLGMLTSTGTTGEKNDFRSEAISDSIFQRISGKSYPLPGHKGPCISRDDLRIVHVLHHDGKGHILKGELICNKAIAEDLVQIFRELYKNRYPIERMRLIDEYDADDERSMRDNNTSCFCHRSVAHSKNLSKHALGLAIDINPLYNPYYRRLANGKEIIQPATASRYCDRGKSFPYKITRNDLCYRLFIQHGFRWGGAWKSLKDYQHFEK